MGCLHWLCLNLVVAWCLDFLYIDPYPRRQADSKTTLIVDMQNDPCHQIGMTNERDLLELGKSFKKHAQGWCGVTAWVEGLGQLNLGDKMRPHSPE